MAIDFPNSPTIGDSFTVGNRTWIWDGTAWELSIVSAIPNTIVDAKGDLIAGTADDTVARLPVGTDGYVLQADSGESTGLIWAPAGGAKLIQTVTATNSSQVTNTTGTFADTNLTATITPTSASNNILVLISQSIGVTRSDDDIGMGVKLLRGATTIYDVSGSSVWSALRTRSGTLVSVGANTIMPMVYLDSPATTSATTYKTQMRPHTTSGSATAYAQRDGATSSIILIEVAP